MTIIINNYTLEEEEEALESVELLVVIIIKKKNLQLNCFKCILLQFNFQYVAIYWEIYRITVYIYEICCLHCVREKF